MDSVFQELAPVIALTAEDLRLKSVTTIAARLDVNKIAPVNVLVTSAAILSQALLLQNASNIVTTLDVLTVLTVIHTATIDTL